MRVEENIVNKYYIIETILTWKTIWSIINRILFPIVDLIQVILTLWDVFYKHYNHYIFRIYVNQMRTSKSWTIVYDLNIKKDFFLQVKSERMFFCTIYLYHYYLKNDARKFSRVCHYIFSLHVIIGYKI